MSGSYLLFVGSVTRPTPYFASSNGSGLSVFSFDPETLGTRLLAEDRSIENPTFLSVRPDTGSVYVNSEIFGWKEGLVTAFSFDRALGTLGYLNMQPSLGSIAAQNIITRDGKHLLVVNYAMGDGGPDQSLAAFPLLDGDKLGAPLASIRHVGSGPDQTRQERSHAHSVIEIGDDMFVVADLGCDTLTTYRFGGETGFVRLSETRCEAGAGPRHTTLHPSGRFLFALNELNSTCASFAIDRQTGKLSPVNVVPSVPEGQRADNHCADIQISPDGRFLYGSNRGHDSIAVFSVSQESGAVELAGLIGCGGRTPRNLAMSPSGRHVFCANQDSDRISIFERNSETGQLVDTGRFIETGTPMCVKIASA